MQDVQKEAQRKIKRELQAAEEAWQKKCVLRTLGLQCSCMQRSHRVLVCAFHRIKDQEKAIRNKTAAEKREALAALKAEYEAKARAKLNEAGAAHAALLKQLNDTESAAAAAAELAAKQLAAAKQAEGEVTQEA